MLGAVLAGCAGRTHKPATPVAPSTQPAAAPAATLPPGLTHDEVAPRQGEALRRAQASLQEVLAELPWPTALLGPRPATQPTTAMASAPAASTTQPDALLRLYSQGRQAWLDRRYHEATRKLQQALTLAPQTPQVLNLLARVYLEAGVVAQAQRYIARAAAAGQPDPHNLLLLGRHLVQNDQPQQAMAVLAYLLDLPSAAADPGIKPLARYLLATVLLRQGRDAAAAEQLERFFEDHAALARTTGYLRELLLLKEQQAVLAVQWGDALSRLDRPAQALRAYARAARLSPDLQAIPPRQVLAHLRLGQGRPAQDLTLQWIRRTRGSGESLKLLDYLAAQGTRLDAELLDTLRQLYRQLDRPASLAIRLAHALPGHEGDRLLAEHLQARPDDRWVLAELVGRAASADRRRLRTVVATVARTIDRLPAAAERYGELLLDAAQGNPHLATVLESSAMDGGPPAARAYLRGQWLRRQQRPDQAAKAYRLAMELKPSFFPAPLALAAVLGQQKDYEQARQVLEPLKSQPQAIALRAELLARSGALDEAIDLLEGLLQRQPHEVQWSLKMAELQFNSGRFTQGAATLQAALEENPRDARLYEALFAFYMSGQAPPDAGRRGLELLTKARQYIPNAPVTRYQLALRLAAAQQFPESQALLRGLMEEDPQDVRALALAMQVSILQGRLDEAQQLFAPRLEWLGTRPEVQQLALELCALHLQRNQPQEALQWLRRLGELRLSRPDAYLHLLGQTYLRLNQQARIAPVAARLLASYPEARADLYYEWAMLENRAGRPRRSEQLLFKGLKIKPDDPKLNNALGYGWADRGRNLSQALRMVSQAVQQEPNNPAFLDSLAWVHYKMGNFQQAVDLLKRAVALPGGDHAVLLDHLGDALYRTGQPHEAVQTWQSALEKLDPQQADEDPELRDLPQRLRAKIQAAQADQAAPVAAADVAAADGPQTTPAPAPASSR